MTSPYDAPEAASGPAASADDVDPSDARPGFIVGVLGFGVVVAGLFAALIWPQLFLMGISVRSLMAVLPPVISLLGVGVAVLGAIVAMGRFWASAVVVPLLAFVALLELIWAVYALLSGMLSVLYPLAIAATLVALGCAAGSLVLTRRISQARNALLYG